MAYVASAPPIKMWSTLAGNSGWYYTSDDQATDVDATDYFTNGHDLGMRTGDVVYIIDADNTSLLVMSYVFTSTSGGATTVVTI